MIVSKILPTRPMQEVHLPENGEVPMPQTTTEAIPEEKVKNTKLLI